MTHWTVVAEYIACAYVLVLIIGMIGDRKTPFRQNRLFTLSLTVTLGCILVNLATVYCAGRVSRAVVVFINALYFALTISMTACIMLDINMLMFQDREHVPHCKHINGILSAMLVAGLIFVFFGTRYGWLFTVSADGVYNRGPLVWFPFWYLAAGIAVLLVGFLAEHTRVRPAFIRVALLLPPLVIGISALQFVFPDTLISGTLGAIVHMVLFIYGQQQRADTDHLTMLASREMFYKTVDAFAKRNILFHVIIVSLRDYKSVNNRFGQRVGDEFLRSVGMWLAAQNKHAVTCRFTGVEFALIVPETKVEDYEKLFAALQERFRHPWNHENLSVRLYATFADIAFPEHASSVNEIISYLEYGARLSKSGEGGGAVRFDKQLRNRIGRRNYVVAQFERALMKDRCFWQYQPVYDCKQKRFVGAELLSRFIDESGATVMPGEFIPLAEEVGLVNTLDHMTIEAACRFLSAHREEGIGWLSVNVTGMEYREPTARAWLYSVLERYGLPEGCLHIEITERVFIEDLEGASEACNALRAHGLRISMDDFGVGYSNLFNVTRLPLDCVKIDKSFVDHITENEKACNLLRVVAGGLQALGTELVAEGVETEAQQQIVERIGVDMVQGFYHARPMDEDAYLALMLKERTP